jgi:hypothetical protein
MPMKKPAGMLPELVMVIVRASLVAPTVRAPNSAGFGVASMIARPPVPLSAAVDFDVAALAGFERVAQAVAVTGPERARAALNFEVVHLHGGFAAVGQLQIGVAVFVDPLQTEVIARRREGEFRLDAEARDFEALIGATAGEMHVESRFLGADAVRFESDPERAELARLETAAVGAAEGEVSSVFAFERNLFDRGFFPAVVMQLKFSRR